MASLALLADQIERVVEVGRLLPTGDLTAEANRADLLLERVPTLLGLPFQHQLDGVVDQGIELRPHRDHLRGRRRIGRLRGEHHVRVLDHVLEHPVQAEGPQAGV